MIHVLATFETQEDVLSAMHRAVSWVKLDEKAALRALAIPPEACDHAGWNFKEHGRGCPRCGVIILDAGD